MKLLFLITALLFNSLLFGQNLPSESPKSKLTQRLGLSDVTITYSRPNVNERLVFGGLVPYDSVWRTGANYPTFIHLSDTTFIEAKNNTLAPGKYAFYTIPGKSKWTLIFSRDTTLWGAYGYNSVYDALRVDVPVKNDMTHTETLTIGIGDVGDESAMITLQWERTAVSFRMMVDIQQRVHDHVLRTIKEKPEWSVYWAGAEHLLRYKTDLEQAAAWAEQSVHLYAWYGNIWTQAEIYAAMGKFDKAVEYGEKAILSGTTGENAPYFSYLSSYRQRIEIWRSSAGKG